MEYPVRGAQNLSRMCLICGVENPAGLKARFYELDNGDLVAVFHPLKEHQGYPGRLHGGISCAILDETIGRAINISRPGTWGVTVELNLRYLKPVPIGRELKAVGRITNDSTRIFEGAGEILLDDGSVAVEARGKYMKLPLSAIAGDSFGEREWFADQQEVPEKLQF